jgi:dynein heavy chain
LIKTFKILFEKRRTEIISMKERYVVGLEKLESAKNNLTVMKNELTELQPKMIKMSEETEELINIIGKTKLQETSTKVLLFS